MWRPGQIDDDVLSFDVASEHDGNLPLVRAERLRIDGRAAAHEIRLLVGDFDADVVMAGHGRENT